MRTVVISFGCPRSGTTFLARCLSPLLGVFAFHLPDGGKLHPCKSREGLIQLDALFWSHRAIFVRIYRSPLDIVESFLALRELKPDIARARDSDQRIIRWITNEHANVAEQRPVLRTHQKNWEPHHLVEVKYEALAGDKGRRAFAETLGALLPRRRANQQRLLDQLETFGDKPANLGKLKARMSGSVMTPRQRAYFTEHLRYIIEAGGYV